GSGREVWGSCKRGGDFSRSVYKSNAVSKMRVEVLREASKDDTGRHHRQHTYLRRGYAPTILGDAWFAAKARPYDHALRREYPLCCKTHGGRKINGSRLWCGGAEGL